MMAPMQNHTLDSNTFWQLTAASALFLQAIPIKWNRDSVSSPIPHLYTSRFFIPTLSVPSSSTHAPPASHGLPSIFRNREERFRSEDVTEI